MPDILMLPAPRCDVRSVIQNPTSGTANCILCPWVPMFSSSTIFTIFTVGRWSYSLLWTRKI